MRIIYKAPRQSGKTELAIHEFMKDWKNSIMIVHNDSTARGLIDRIGRRYELDEDTVIEMRKRVRGYNADSLCALEGHTIIFDEYFFFKLPGRQEIMRHAISHFKNIIIFSTIPSKWVSGDRARHKACKKEINELMSIGFSMGPKIAPLDPREHFRRKEEEKIIYYSRKLAKMGYETIRSKSVTVVNNGNLTVTNHQGAVTTSVTRMDPNTPFTYTHDAGEFKPKPDGVKRAVKYIQGKLAFPGQSKQLSLFD